MLGNHLITVSEPYPSFSGAVSLPMCLFSCGGTAVRLSQATGWELTWYIHHFQGLPTHHSTSDHILSTSANWTEEEMARLLIHSFSFCCTLKSHREYLNISMLKLQPSLSQNLWKWNPRTGLLTQWFSECALVQQYQQHLGACANQKLWRTVC